MSNKEDKVAEALLKTYETIETRCSSIVNRMPQELREQLFLTNIRGVFAAIAELYDGQVEDRVARLVEEEVNIVTVLLEDYFYHEITKDLE
jgi:hypothetical protein